MSPGQAEKDEGSVFQPESQDPSPLPVSQTARTSHCYQLRLCRPAWPERPEPMSQNQGQPCSGRWPWCGNRTLLEKHVGGEGHEGSCFPIFFRPQRNPLAPSGAQSMPALCPAKRSGDSAQPAQEREACATWL